MPGGWGLPWGGGGRMFELIGAQFYLIVFFLFM